jgi:hypothetical protein
VTLGWPGSMIWIVRPENLEGLSANQSALLMMNTAAVSSVV